MFISSKETPVGAGVLAADLEVKQIADLDLLDETEGDVAVVGSVVREVVNAVVGEGEDAVPGPPEELDRLPAEGAERDAQILLRLEDPLRVELGRSHVEDGLQTCRSVAIIHL